MQMTSSFEEREAVCFENQGKKIFGVMHRPIKRNSFPAVICCHGFGGSKIGKNRMWVMIAESLSKEGIASLRFDFRGCGDSEGYFEEMTIESCISDATAALDFLEKDPSIDSSKLGIIGCSLGGAIAVKVASESLKFKSLALLSAVANGDQWKGKWEEFQSIRELYEPNPYLQGEERGASKEFFEQFIFMRIDKEMERLSSLPFMHVHGALDEIVSLDHMHVYKEIRDKATSKSFFLTLPNSDHWFRNPEDRSILLQKTAKWFRSTL